MAAAQWGPASSSGSTAHAARSPGVHVALCCWLRSQAGCLARPPARRATTPTYNVGPPTCPAAHCRLNQALQSLQLRPTYEDVFQVETSTVEEYLQQV